MYRVAQTRTRLLGRRTLRPQAAKQVLSECAISTSRQNLLQIQYLNPLLVARAPGVKGHGMCQPQVNERARDFGTGLSYSTAVQGMAVEASEMEMDVLLRELWNEGEVSIPPFYRTECFFHSAANCKILGV